MAIQLYSTNRPHCLTMTIHPGNLSNMDIVQNIMRMLLMDEGMDAKTAQEEFDKLPVDEYRKFRKVAKEWRYDQEMQDYLDRMHIKELIRCNRFQFRWIRRWDIMDEFSLKGLYL